MRYMNFTVFSLDPCQLIDNFIPPFIHALVPYMHLRVKDPQETEAFGGQSLDWYVYDLLIAHRRILQIELIVRKHKT